MSTQQNIATIRRWYDEVLNGKNLAAVDELHAPGFVTHYKGSPGGDLAGVKAMLAGSFAGMPDMRATVEDLVAEGDRVCVRLAVRGTHTGEFMGLPPTGRSVTTSVIEVLRFEDGKIAEHWAEADALGLMQQLGAAP